MDSGRGYQPISSIFSMSIGVLKRFVLSKFDYHSLYSLGDISTLNLLEAEATPTFKNFFQP